jgi:phosphoglycerol transferase MdoB-like AlkP superfamily enzyme
LPAGHELRIEFIRLCPGSLRASNRSRVAHLRGENTGSLAADPVAVRAGDPNVRAKSVKPGSEIHLPPGGRPAARARLRLLHENAVVGIVGTGIALWLFQIGIQAGLAHFGLSIVRSPLHYLPRLLLISFYGFLYCAGLTVLLLAFLALFRRRKSAGRNLQAAFLVIALLSLILALLDLQFARATGVLFTYQWLFYSDFLAGVHAHQAIRANLSWASILYLVALCLALVALSFGIGRILAPFSPIFRRSRIPLLSVVGALLFYLPVAAWYQSTHVPVVGTYDYPILHFLKSCLTARTNAPLFSMKTSVGNDDFLPGAARSAPSVVSHARRPDAEVRNVILFVMESVGAPYVEAFGGQYPVTPTISRYEKKAALFDKIYSPVPFSTKALWSLECGIYPWITHDTISRQCPQIAVASLSSELKDHGYRTAFFNSSDNRYQNASAFLAHRSFDLIADCNTLTKSSPTLRGTSKEHGDEGCDDQVTVAALNDWIDQQDGRPFFGMLWTVMTHSPYFPRGPEATYDAGDALKNRYLNALHASDEALSKLLTHLEERGLMEFTLVVVIGDHGEAFGQHNTWCHVAIHEECVHVPLLFINPRLFHGDRHHQIGGSVDVAPTILDLLGYSAPGAWQGSSLFAANRGNRAYFFVPLGEYWFGFREDDLVFLYNASTAQYQIYDMAKDPGQTRNLAREKRALLPLATERLAAWVQFQNKYIAELMQASPPSDDRLAQVARR